MLGFDLDTARNMSTWVTAGAIVFALGAVWLVKQVVTKVLTVLVLLALAGLVWSQRAELTDCADRVQTAIASALHEDTTCTFFGQDVTVPGAQTLFNNVTPNQTTQTPQPTTTPNPTALPPE
jgi:hypothetical protein